MDGGIYLLMFLRLYVSVQRDSTVKADTIFRANADSDGKAETAGFSLSNSHPSSAPIASLDSWSDGFCTSKSSTAAASVRGNCMDMSVDEQSNSVLAAENPNTHSKLAEPRSGTGSQSCLSHIVKQAATSELMDGSFRDESMRCHGDTVHSATNFLPTSAPTCVAKTDNLKSATVPDKPTIKTVSAVEAVDENCTKKDGVVKSIGRDACQLNSHPSAPVSFNDVAKSAAIPQSETNTSQVNNSFAYRDQSAILISDDDDDEDDDEVDDNADKRDDKTEDCRPLVAGTEAAGGKQKTTLETQKKDTSSKPLPESKPQSSSCEVSVGGVCQPSTVITIRPPAHSSIQTVDTLTSRVDMEKVLARRETVSKLLDHKRVSTCLCCCFIAHAFVEVIYVMK